MLLSRRRVFSARALEIPRGRTNELLQPHTHTKMNVTILRRMGRRDLDRRARSRRGRESLGRRVGDGVISRRATVIVFPGIHRYRVCRCEAAARRGHLHRCNPGAERRIARRFGAEHLGGLAARDGRSRDVLQPRRSDVSTLRATSVAALVGLWRWRFRLRDVRLRYFGKKSGERVGANAAPTRRLSRALRARGAHASDRFVQAGVRDAALMASTQRS